HTRFDCDWSSDVCSSDLTVADIERWHTRMRRAGVGEVAIKNRHTVLRAAFTQAVRWGWLSTNPVATARLTHAKRLPRSSMSADRSEERRVGKESRYLGAR